MTFYGYVDRTDDGFSFYVGIGNEIRLKSFKRNRKHNNVAKKHGINRVIEFETESYLELCEWEIATIYALKTFHLESDNDLGSNFTYGGEGNLGWIPSSETRTKQAQARLGKSSWNKGLHHSESTKAKISMKRKGKTSWNLGVKHSEASLEKMRVARAKQEKMSLETREKIRQTNLGKKRICKICGLAGHFAITCKTSVIPR